MPYDWPLPLNCAFLQVRYLPYIEYLESQIRLLKELLPELPIQRATRRRLDTYKQELQRVISARSPQVRPLLHIVHQAFEFRQFIWDLETNIRDLEERIKIPNTEPKATFRDTLDSLRNRLRKAKLNWDRLPPIHGLPPPVHSRDGFEWHLLPNGTFMITAAGPRPRILRRVGIIEGIAYAHADLFTDGAYDVRTGSRVDLNSPDAPVFQTSATTRDRFGELFRGPHPLRRVNSSPPTHPLFWHSLPNAEVQPRPRIVGGVARVNTVADDDHNVRTGSRGDLNSPDAPVVRKSATTRDRFGELFQGGHPTRRVNTSTPTVVAPQTRGEANHAVTEDLATGHGTSAGRVAGKGGHSTITKGTGTEGSSNPNPTSEDQLRSDTRDPVKAAPPRSPSPPHGDPDLDRPNPPTPEIGSQEIEEEVEAVSLIDDHDNDSGGASSSAASRSNLQDTAARALAAMAPDDALNEELYSGAY